MLTKSKWSVAPDCLQIDRTSVDSAPNRQTYLQLTKWENEPGFYITFATHLVYPLKQPPSNPPDEDTNICISSINSQFGMATTETMFLAGACLAHNDTRAVPADFFKGQVTHSCHDKQIFHLCLQPIDGPSDLPTNSATCSVQYRSTDLIRGPRSKSPSL